VVTIGDNAFKFSSSLTSITDEAVAPPTLGGSSVFDDTNNCPIYVPIQSVATYKAAANWSEYQARIQGYGASAYINYTSSDGNIVTPVGTIPFGADVSILDNTYSAGVGTISLSNAPTIINGGAFADCSTLRTVTIPSSVTEIRNSAFTNSGLSSIDIPATVTSIGNGIFGGCNNLTTITVDSNNTVYDDRNGYCNGIVETNTNKLVAACTSTNILNEGVDGGGIGTLSTITAIGPGAFKGLINLTSLILFDNITLIEPRGIMDCTNLINIIAMGETPPTVYSDSFYNLA